MLSDFLSVYVILHVFFFVLSTHIFSRFSQDLATQLEYRSFRVLLGAYLVYLAASVLSTVISLGPAAPHWLAVVIWNAALLSEVLVALSLYIFTVFRYAPHLVRRRYFSFFSALPAAGLVACMLVSLRNGMILRVDASGRAVYGPWYYLLPGLMMLYFAMILAFALYELNRTRSYVREKQLAVLIMSCVGVFVVVMVDTFFRSSYFSILPGGILLAIVFLYINMQDSGIYTDTLTGMNNRRKANEYLGQYLRESVEKTPIYLYMCDVNNFKLINDQYGHDEGDQALILVAEALKGTMAWYEGFAARLGGDEFLLTWAPLLMETASNPDTFVEDVRSALALECARAQKPYQISLSLGYTYCADPKKSLSDYIREADHMLYEHKRAFHANEEKE